MRKVDFVLRLQVAHLTPSSLDIFVSSFSA